MANNSFENGMSIINLLGQVVICHRNYVSLDALNLKIIDGDIREDEFVQGDGRCVI